MYRQELEKIIERHHFKGDVTFLGEGAWHDAFLIEDNHKKLVLRLPKKVAYGEKVEFNEREWRTEYEGQKLFYHHANQANSGIAPEYFDYYVDKECTYTLESFAGEKVDLHQLPLLKAYDIGAQYGEFFRKLNNHKHPLKGFGYLRWSQERFTVEGEMQSSVSAFMEEENKEILEEDFPYLSQSSYSFDREKIYDKLENCVATRSISNVSFTNQDTSPENILLQDNKIRIIDPYPVLYYGHTFAGNFLNNYDTLFIALHNSPRYKKHNFDQVSMKLKAIAQGFMEQYCLQDKETQVLVKREQYVQLFSTTVEHVKMVNDTLPISKVLRYGTKEQIEARIPLFLYELEEFES